MKKLCLERFFILPKIAKQCQNHNYNQDHIPRNPALKKIKKAFSIFNLPWESFLCQLPNFKNLPFAFMGKKKSRSIYAVKDDLLFLSTSQLIDQRNWP